MGKLRTVLGGAVCAVLSFGLIDGADAAVARPPVPSLGPSFSYTQTSVSTSCAAGLGTVKVAARWNTATPTRRTVRVDGRRPRTFAAKGTSGRDVATFTRLRPGTHVIEFSAPVGGAAVRRTVRVCATRLALAVKPSTVTRGHRVRVQAVVKRNGHPLAGAKVALYARRSGSTVYKRVKLAHTNRAGRVTAVVAPKVSTAYRWRAVGGASSSRTTVVRVRH